MTSSSKICVTLASDRRLAGTTIWTRAYQEHNYIEQEYLDWVSEIQKSFEDMRSEKLARAAAFPRAKRPLHLVSLRD